MTLRARARPASRIASAIVLVPMLLAALAGSVAAADPITLEARALVGGRYEAGGWVALSVSLANDGPPISGYLAADSEDGTVRHFVELPAGSRKEVALYLRPASFARAVAVRFESSEGASLATAAADVRVLERTTGHVALVGDGGGNLRPQLIARAAGLPDPIPLTATDLPDRPEALRGIETIVWAADSSGLREAQRRSLERWIAAGGQLVVLGGPDWQARAAGFAELLPVEALEAVDDAPLAPLAAWVGADAPEGATTLTASVGTLRDGGVALIGSGETVAFAAIGRGAGRVAWLGFDLATEPFRAWPGAAILWGRVVPDDRLALQMVGQPPLDEEVAGVLTQALANLPALEVPPAELLLAVIIGYILLIGPVSYVVLRRLDRRELAWITAPILVVVFSAGSYAIGSSMKGSDIIVNEIAIVRVTTGGTAASVSTYAGVFSPSRNTYDLTARADALFSALQNTSIDPALAAPATYATEQGDPSHLRGLSVSVFGLQAVRAEAIVPYTPSLLVDWSFGVGVIEGTVTNAGAAAVEDVAVVGQSGGVMVGTLEPGASKAFTLSARNLGGSRASEMVYGFANFDNTTTAGRRETVRRQVIDSLVGFGSGWGRFGIAGGGIDQGPFVIGWQTDVSPIPVEVDGHEAQHFAQAVEVLSGRPRLGPGPVALEPAQLTTTVISTFGEASQNEPGYVTLGDGEVVFQINLPLEASRIAPSKVTLLGSTDPSSIFFNQGNQVALLPSGYRLSAYDLVVGEWFDVGDLSTRGRFEIENPARVLDPAGRILVRISGSDVPEEFGQMSVYAGAAVEGVI